MQAPRAELKVTVFSDYICPFCYIGSERLRHLNKDYDLKVDWRGFEIHPETPAQGMPLTQLGYPPAQWSRMMAALDQMAKQEDIELGPREFTTNSHKALLLSEAAKQAGQDVFDALHRRLFQAFFTFGKNIGDEKVLTELAQEAGLSQEAIASTWQDPRFEEALNQNLRAAARLGIHGTPTFIIGEEIVVGAVPYEDLQEAAKRASRGK
jgi:predicted DsbA family dithiol-disulfide isomerase